MECPERIVCGLQSPVFIYLPVPFILLLYEFPCFALGLPRLGRLALGAVLAGFLCLRCLGFAVFSFFFPSRGFVGRLSPLPSCGCLSSPFGWVRVSSLPVRFRVGLAWECVSLAFSSGGRGLGWFLSALALCFGFRSSSVS